MKTAVLFFVAVAAISAQKPAECQRPDAHMNPNCSGGSSAPTSPAINVSGVYDLKGTTPEGGRYEGTVTITGDAQNGYQFHWSLPNDQYNGTGTLNGDTITVEWGAPEPAIYKVLNGGALLKGKWGKGGRGREKLKRSGS